MGHEFVGEVVEAGFLSVITQNEDPAPIRLDPFKRWPTRSRRMALGYGQKATIGKPRLGLLLELRCCVSEEVLSRKLRKVSDAQSSGAAQRRGFPAQTRATTV